MSRQAITVELPEEVYRHVKRAAEGMKRPVERVLASIVQGATPSLEKVPAQYHPDLESLETLGNEELRRLPRVAFQRNNNAGSSDCWNIARAAN